MKFDDFSPLRPPPSGTESKIGHGNVFKQCLEVLNPGENRAQAALTVWQKFVSEVENPKFSSNPYCSAVSQYKGNLWETYGKSFKILEKWSRRGSCRSRATFLASCRPLSVQEHRRNILERSSGPKSSNPELWV